MRRFTSLATVIAPSLAMVLTGCSSKKECTLSAISGIVVSVKDETSATAICDATVTIRDGSFEQTLVADSNKNDCSYAGADERPGSYEIEVVRAGYSPATLAAVVPEDSSGCHVVPQFISASLSPQQSGGDASAISDASPE